MSSIAPSDVFAKKVNLALHRDLSTGKWYLDQIEVSSSSIRSVTKFTKRTEIKSAFSEEFLQSLRPYLPSSLRQQVRSISGVVISLRDVYLEDLRVLCQSPINGIQRVIVRFNNVLGQIFQVLTVHHRPDFALQFEKCEVQSGTSSLETIRVADFDQHINSKPRQGSYELSKDSYTADLDVLRDK